jgi:alpha-tubulin suppressor-like RCC1 family protein
MIENNLGKLIGVTPTVNSTTASGIFTLDQQYDQVSKDLWPAAFRIDYLIVGGGGSGGGLSGGGNPANFSITDSWFHSAGGGGGGAVLEFTNKGIAPGTYSVEVGRGGQTSVGGTFRERGFPSRFMNITAGGGGAGAIVPFDSSSDSARFGQNGQDNSSSGGGSVYHTYASGFGQNGYAIQNGIRDGVGSNGAMSAVTFSASTYGGGGGGAGGAGSTFTGGTGKISTITGLYYGGGGNAVFTANTPTVRVLNTYGTNSTGGQGYYSGVNNGTYVPARSNSGGGGGAQFKWRNEQFISDDGVPRHGANGVVVIRYVTGELSAIGGNMSTNGIYTLHTFTSNGTITISSVTSNLYSWGLNLYGQLGQNNTSYRSSPTQVGTETDWNLISIGFSSVVATKTNGTLWSWGLNQYGRLGLGDRAYRSSPTQIGTGTNWNNINHGDISVVATKTDGTLWTWGSNQDGVLGQNNMVYRSSPVQVGTNTNWSKISSGINAILATKTDGTLWAWGTNSQGELGLNDRINRSSPVQVSFDTNWSKIFNKKGISLAIKTDGTLWSWGSNFYGQLGLNDRINRSSPTQVGIATNWRDISFGAAIKTDGTLWSWGRNQLGQLGQNNLIYRSSPVQVGTANNWLTVSSGTTSDRSENMSAIKTDGTLWSWGQNLDGVLGTNNTTYRSSPVQVGTDITWSNVSVGYGTMLATKKS